MEPRNIGFQIKQLRKEKGFTQKQLSEKTGIAEITIRQYEAGKYKPKVDNLLAIAMALGVTMSDLSDDYSDYDRMVLRLHAYLVKLKEMNIDFSEAGKITTDVRELDAMRHFRPLNDDNKDKAIDYMAYLKERQDQD